MISLDTEATGIDTYHGAQPFFVTICYESGEQQWWEEGWEPDPLTRKVSPPEEDVEAIREIVQQADAIVLQNAKFDIAALATVGINDWPWEKTHDTLIAGHILASNQPHDLTSMAIQYLGRHGDIQHYEDRLKVCVEKARRIAKAEFNGKVLKSGQHSIVRGEEWRLASVGLPEMPSAKGSTWKYDTWLPRLLAARYPSEESKEWLTVLRDYSNADSAVTLALWQVMERELKDRDLWEIYCEKMKVLSTLYEMESRGVTSHKQSLTDLRQEYIEEIEAREKLCKGVASSFNYELDLPKSGNNKSLTTFAFNILKLPTLKYTENGNNSLDKEVIEEYKKTLPANSKQLLFIKSLSGIRKRQKSNEFLDSYSKFGIPDGNGTLIIHPSTNPTGTTTTRFSYSKPNLQQVSKQETECERCAGEGCDECGGTGEDLHSVRRVFGPAPGREWWCADAKNIELRIPAYESEEPDLVNLFEKANEPPYWGSQHILNFSIVYDEIWEKEARAVGLDKVGPHCKKKYASTFYQWTKNGGLAMQYQCGEKTADRSFHRPGGFAKLKSTFTLLDALNTKYVRYANKHGFVETLPDKTVNPKRGYPILCSRGEWGSIKPTTPLNYHTQGTAGWWMLKAMNRCQAKLLEWRKEGWNGYIVLTVHDELVFDFPKWGDPVTESERVKKSNGRAVFRTSNLWRARILQRLMEQGGEDIGIPTLVSLEYVADNWSRGVAL